MAKPTTTRWADGDAAYRIAPSGPKQTLGWLAGEKPPNQIMNYIHGNVYDWITYLQNKTETIYPTLIRSDATASWNGSTGVLTFASPIQISFRYLTGEQINQFAAGSFTLTDGQVLVLVKDKTNPSPVTITLGTYPTLGAAQYAIVSEGSLSATNQEKETVIFRMRGTDLEIPCLGQIYANGATISFGSFNGSGITIAASQVTSGTFADARIAASNVTQHQAALAIAASQVTSGTFADARIAASNVTQHQAALVIAASQITSGTLPVARGGTGTTTSTGTGNVVLSDNPTFGGSGIVLPDASPLANVANINGIGKVFGHIRNDGVILDSQNVASVTHLATGRFHINFTIAFASTNYAMAGSIVGVPFSFGLPLSFGCLAVSTTQMLIEIYNSTTGAAVDATFDIIVFGRQ